MESLKKNEGGNGKSTESIEWNEDVKIGKPNQVRVLSGLVMQYFNL